MAATAEGTVISGNDTKKEETTEKETVSDEEQELLASRNCHVDSLGICEEESLLGYAGSDSRNEDDLPFTSLSRVNRS